jgi:hypothetical protein
METNNTERAPLPEAPGSVIWADAGGRHWALFARDGQARDEAFIHEHGEDALLYNWVSLDPSMTWVKDSDINAWEPRFIPSPAESVPSQENTTVPEQRTDELPESSGTVIWGYAPKIGWSLFARGDGGGTDWISLGVESRFLYADGITYGELRYHPSPAESRPQLGFPTYHLDDDGYVVETKFDTRLLY